MKKFTLGNSVQDVEKMIPKGRVKKILLGSKEIAVVRKGEEFYAFSMYCPHKGASLIQGSINIQGEIICPLHQYRFELKTGKIKSGYCPDLDVFPTLLTAIGLEISIP